MSKEEQKSESKLRDHEEHGETHSETLRYNSNNDHDDNDNNNNNNNYHRYNSDPGLNNNNNNNNDIDNDNETVPLSFQDRITAQAVAGTIELLKLAGGVTLSTTGALVAPPLHITKTLLLPQLWAATKDYIQTNSPERLQDWYNIIHTSIYHIINTLKNTSAGYTFRNRLLITISDLIQVLSADNTRQLLLDITSCWIKLFDILYTPEFYNYIQQVTKTIIEYINVISDGRNKLLIYDLKETIWTACALAADPVTTVALAETTAYLCYALEMEQQQKYNNNNKLKKTKRRKERDQYEILQNKQSDTLYSNTNITVEQAILNSLGTPMKPSNYNDDNNNDSLPDYTDTNSTTFDSGSLRQHINDINNNQKDESNNNNNEHWSCERARRGINVQKLREGIEQRSVQIHNIKQQRKQQKQQEEQEITVEAVDDDDDDDDMEDLAQEKMSSQMNGYVQKTSSSAKNKINIKERHVRPRATIEQKPETMLKSKESIVSFHDFQKESRNNNNDDDNNNTEISTLINNIPKTDRLDGETPSKHFHRVLDEVLTRKRKEAVIAAIKGEKIEKFIPKYPVVRPSAKLKNVKDRWASLRNELKSINTNNNNNNNTCNEDKIRQQIESIFSKKGKTTILIALGLIAFLILFWFSLGCYGLYVIIYPPPTGRDGYLTTTTKDYTIPPPNQEIVIRIIKEVVHVDKDGTEFSRGLWNKENSNNDDDSNKIDKIAECVSDVYS